MVSKGIKFVRAPKEESYGLVAVFEDLYGNLWDLLQINSNHPLFERNGSDWNHYTRRNLISQE